MGQIIEGGRIKLIQHKKEFHSAVIFAQAIDYSHYQRYPEIQRRFIITNPKMSAERVSYYIKHLGRLFPASNVNNSHHFPEIFLIVGR